MEKYSKFYNDLILKWKQGGEGTWAGLYYGVFSDVIQQNNFKKCAEVGIGYGFHAKEILDHTNVEHLFLVDPMCYYPNDLFVEHVIQYGGFEELVRNIKNHLQEHESRYTWFRQPSVSITSEQIPDGSLDAVFIDADHSYEAVQQDLEFWWKKLRVGGWMLGDDYQSCHPGTTKAVNEFSAKHSIPIEFLYKPTQSYPIYKFIKNHD